MYDYKGIGDNKYVYMPKIGEEIEVKIKEVRKVTEGKDMFHFKMRDTIDLPNGGKAVAEKSLGYHIEAELEDGRILSVTSLAAFLMVFKKHQINDGDHVHIEHPAKGSWIVTKL